MIQLTELYVCIYNEDSSSVIIEKIDDIINNKHEEVFVKET